MRISVQSRQRLSQASLAAASALALFWPWCASFAWGHEGHQVIGLIAEHYMTPAALGAASDLLDGASIDSVASWADDYRHDHPETGQWPFIIPRGEPSVTEQEFLK